MIYNIIQIPIIKVEQIPAKYGNNLNEFSSFKLFIETENATIDNSIDDTPALPKYILPAPSWE